MDSHLVVPRLRLSRQSPWTRPDYADLSETPQAGPSRISPRSNTQGILSDDEDNQATPRVVDRPHLAEDKNSDPLFSENSTTRLRALLARIPNSPVENPPHRRPRPPSISDFESDLDIPNVTAPSLARESLKELFSHALREPGDTPQKTRLRRNSIDASEVEASPRIEDVARERAKNKGKRRSMSDEEGEKFSKSSQRSDTSYRSSQAATFDALRQRLQSSSSRRSPPSPEQSQRVPERSRSDMELSDGPAEASGDTATLMRHLDREASNLSALPVASSTPMRSVQMPSRFEMQSNLMDQDSEMQNAMKGTDSSYDYESKSSSNQKRPPFPSVQNGSTESAPRAHSKSHSAHGIPLARRVSGGDFGASSSRSSSISAADIQERQREFNGDKQRERERFWNKPAGKSPGQTTPEHVRFPSNSSPSYNTTIMARGGSPRGVMGRRSSSASMHGFEDGRRSATSSISSRSDYIDRMKDTEQDKNKQRERLWNKPEPALRSSSSLSMHSPLERSRTNSQPKRPDSAQSLSRSGSRPLSWHSVSSASGSDRPYSPAGSLNSIDREWLEKNPIVVERERNWNSAHPRWEHQVPRPMSPIPSPPIVASSPYAYKGTPNGSPSSSQSISRTQPRSTQILNGGSPRSSARIRTQSMNDQNLTKSLPPLTRAGTDSKIPRANSPSLRKTPETSEEYGTPLGSGPGSRFGWSFPKKRDPLPPLDLQDESDTQAVNAPSSSRLAAPDFAAATGSHIPVRSPSRRKLRAKQSSSREQPVHVARSDESIEGAVPAIDVRYADREDIPTDSEIVESDLDSHATSTPLARPAPLPTTTEGSNTTSSTQPSFYSIHENEQPPAKPPSRSSTPPNKPSSPRPQSPLFTLQTPPRRPSFSASKTEFKTPSPPRNMPELPGPPSSSEEEIYDQTPVNLIGDFTAAKTPRPPGAWATTPLPTERLALESAVSSHNAKHNEENLTPRAGPDNSILPAPTPAPPGGWVPTPAGSLRRRSILKVRFDVDPNTSGDSLASIPIIGPSDLANGDSISDVFPLVDQQQVMGSSQPARMSRDPKQPTEEQSIKPPVRTRTPPKSPGGVRVLDAFGREVPVESEPSSPSSISPGTSNPDTKKMNTASTPRNKSVIRMVDAMGREVTEASMDDSEISLDVPKSHNEAVARVRDTLAHLKEELGESDDHRELAVRQDRRLSELQNASNAARAARRSIAESLQNHKSREDDMRSKYGSLRESMNKNKLLSPVVSHSRFSINFLNTWVLWSLLIFQVLLLVYMYRLSTIRAKHIFLTTYYDAFYPDLFLHLNKHRAIHGDTWSLASFTDTLTRVGWRGVVGEAWGNMTHAVLDWQNQIWDAWGQEGRTTAWPPT